MKTADDITDEMVCGACFDVITFCDPRTMTAGELLAKANGVDLAVALAAMQRAAEHKLIAWPTPEGQSFCVDSGHAHLLSPPP